LGMSEPAKMATTMAWLVEHMGKSVPAVGLYASGVVAQRCLSTGDRPLCIAISILLGSSIFGSVLVYRVAFYQ
jgi:hypothetical protein